MPEIAKQILLSAIGGWLSVPVAVFIAVALLFWFIGRNEQVREYRRRKPLEMLAVYVASGAALGFVMWWVLGHQASQEAAAPARAPVSQSASGIQSPAIIGNQNTVIYGSPSSVLSAEEKAYRIKLADELNDSAHSLMKSVNRWYTESLGRNRPEADKNWKQAKTRMEESRRLLQSKVNRTAATEFIQNQAGQPPAHMNLVGLGDGAAISDMWHRYNRMTQIERRVRDGTEQIVWPPPSSP